MSRGVLVQRGGPSLRSVAWDANSGGDNVTNYNLYFSRPGGSSGVYDGAGSPVNAGTAIAYKMTAQTGKVYYALTAVNVFGESGFSNEIHYP